MFADLRIDGAKHHREPSDRPVANCYGDARFAARTNGEQHAAQPSLMGRIRPLRSTPRLVMTGLGVDASTPPMTWPYYGVGFAEAVRRGYRKWMVVDGRAGFGEYWWFVLFVVLTTFILGGLDRLIFGTEGDGGPLMWVGAIFYLASMVPIITLTIRRLHDTGRSGWAYLYGFIPLVGGFILFVIVCGATRSAAERFGPPYYTEPASAAGGSSADTGPRQADILTSGPPPRGRGPALLIGIVTVASVVALAGAIWPMVGMYQVMRSVSTADSGAGGPNPGGKDQAGTDQAGSDLSTIDTDTSWETPSEEPSSTWPDGSEPTETTAPASVLDAPAHPDDVGSSPEVWQYSAGSACSTSESKTVWGGYPRATCRFWKDATGATTDQIMAKGSRRIACQRDLGLDNPVYAKSQSNTWWVWAETADLAWDWFPETAIAQGESDQAVNGIAICQ